MPFFGFKMAFDFKKVYKEFYQPKKIQILNIPPMNYVAVRGKGDPNEPNGAYQKAISVLYAVSYILKMSYKSDYKIKDFLNMLRLMGFGGKMIYMILIILKSSNLILLALLDYLIL